jgi:predicted nucleic acid-binding protein
LNKPKDTRGPIYQRHVEGKLVALSFITIGELLYGAYKDKWGQDRLEAMKARLKSVVIVPYDFVICETYADLKEKLRVKGKRLADNDLWIAACAVRHSIPLVSNNRPHFEVIPELILISEAPAIAQIESQGKILEPAKPSSEPAPPSVQSPSSEPEKA